MNQKNNIDHVSVSQQSTLKKKYIQSDLFKYISHLLKLKNAVIVAHYYTSPEIQELADSTGGKVADSLEMAKFGQHHTAKTLLVAGVRFMGETAKILNPEKTVLMPTLKAECSLDLSCPEIEFNKFCDKHPERTVVVYANTSAAIKARAHWVVTSSIAIKLIDYLDSLGKKIIWAPDKHLGHYIQKKTGADILSWHGTCIVHDEFKANSLYNMKKVYPQAAVLAHPESPENVLALADFIGSTSELIKSAQSISQKQIIIATDRGILFKMQQACPDKILLEAPTSEVGMTCLNCGMCPWMKMNTLKKIINSLTHDTKQHEIHVPKNLQKKALKPLIRMLKFSEKIF